MKSSKFQVPGSKLWIPFRAGEEIFGVAGNLELGTWNLELKSA
jgi:hypothetical protein